MNKLFLCLLFLSTPLFGQETPVLTTEEPTMRKTFNPHKSHWLVSFGFEGLKYEVPFEFQGEAKNISPGKQELWGGRFGVGGEIYLGRGFMTRTKLEGYYVGTLFARRLNAGPDDEDEEFAYTKRIGQVWGFDATQSIGYMFNMKTKNPFMNEWAYLTVEPFIEAGIGMGFAFNRIDYSYDIEDPSSGTCSDCFQEGYKQIVDDRFVSTRIGAGVHLTSSTGYFLYMKGTVYTFDITQRKLETFIRPDGQAGDDSSDTLKDVNIDPIISYAIGGGYKF